MHGPTCVFWANLTPFTLVDTVQQRTLHSDVENAPSAAAAELPRRPSGAVDLGNPLLNAISRAVRGTLVSNLYSVPTDCPQVRKTPSWTRSWANFSLL